MSLQTALYALLLCMALIGLVQCVTARGAYRGASYLRLGAIANWVLVVSLALAGLAPSVRAESIPDESVQYRWRVYFAAAGEFGVHASPARLAAQLHQESRWRADARSPYALGIAQFTPQTAAWLGSVCPNVGQFDPWDAGQSIRAAACYDRWLYDQVTAASECDRWAFVLSAYNGGLTWLRRDQQRASAFGADRARWFGHTELYTSRANWARDENRRYVRRILLTLEPLYIGAGWYGVPVCPETP